MSVVPHRLGPQQCGVRESDAAGDDGIRGGGAARGVGPRAPVEAASGRAPAARKRPMRCRLEDWALPAPVIAAFHAKGVTQVRRRRTGGAAGRFVFVSVSGPRLM